MPIPTRMCYLSGAKAGQNSIWEEDLGLRRSYVSRVELIPSTVQGKANAIRWQTKRYRLVAPSRRTFSPWHLLALQGSTKAELIRRMVGIADGDTGG